MDRSPPGVTEETSSQAFLGTPAEIATPSTPILSDASVSASPDMQLDAPVAASRTVFVSPPPPPSSSDMTPPPSSQDQIVANTPACHSRSASSPVFASPPASVDQTLCVAYGASENLPTETDIDVADDVRLRKLAKGLLVAAQGYRMSAAHFKLQNSLLSLTSSEAVKRAEVEQRLARREVEILQSEGYRNRQAVAIDRPSPPVDSEQLDQAHHRIRELDQLNATLDRRLRRAKRLIEEDNDKNELLVEENSRLKKRIRENREHFTLMLDHRSLAHSPRAEFLSPQHRSRDCFPESARSKFNRVGSQDPFAALLAADQVLSRESGSVPSTPANVNDHRNYYSHARGSHSLSSLPVTPSRRKLEANDENSFYTPSKQSDAPHSVQQPDGRDRRDRDSTISASDVEEALTDEDVPASQASSLATNMLRCYPSTNQEASSFSSNVGKSSTLLQTKLFGHVSKAGVRRPSDVSLKRKPSVDQHQGPATKRVKAGELFGVGVHP